MHGITVSCYGFDALKGGDDLAKKADIAINKGASASKVASNAPTTPKATPAQKEVSTSVTGKTKGAKAPRNTPGTMGPQINKGMGASVMHSSGKKGKSL